MCECELIAKEPRLFLTLVLSLLSDFHFHGEAACEEIVQSEDGFLIAINLLIGVMLIYNQDVEQGTCDSSLSLDERLDIARQLSEKTTKSVETELDDFILEIEM